MKNFSVFLLLIPIILSLLLTFLTSPIRAQRTSIYSLEATLNSAKSSTNQDYIFYSTGHHGHIWSKFLRDSVGLHISIGTSRSRNDQAICQSFDTINLIEDNIKTIAWGFDSLWREAKQLKPVYRTMYNPVFKELYIVRNNDTLFTLGDAEKFIGKDSNVFNHKLQKLMSLMSWLASPSIREYLPTPADTLNNEK